MLIMTIKANRILYPKNGATVIINPPPSDSFVPPFMNLEPPIYITDVLCQKLHDAYEQEALNHGWKTQEKSRVSWFDLPEANKNTMRGAMRVVLDEIGVRHD